MKDAILNGVSLIPGMIQGRAFVVGYSRLESIPSSFIPEDQVRAEVEKFWVSLEISVSELQGLVKRVKRDLGEREARIFDAHILMLKDRRMVSRIAARVDFEKMSAESAVIRTFLELIKSFRGHGDELREKFSSDLQDLALRLVKNLSPFFTYDKAVDLQEPVIVIARELIPSVVVRFDKRWILGFVTRSGSLVTHAGILLRAMGVPCISGIRESEEIRNGDRLYVDGLTGKVFVNPGKKVEGNFCRSLEEFHCVNLQKEFDRESKGETRDGQKIECYANIWFPADIEIANAVNADGMGTIRTEFAYVFQNKPPLEDELTEYHRSVIDKIDQGPVHFRLLDVGGETDLPGSIFDRKYANLTGLKFLIAEKNLFISQIRSILALAKDRYLGIVFPFFESWDDFSQAAELYQLEKEKHIRESGLEPKIHLGALLETPDSIEYVQEILKVCHFVVIGSNDLSLRVMGLERAQKIDLKNYKMLSLRLVKLIQKVKETCHLSSKALYVSGQMAEDPLYVAVMIALGIRKLNMAASSIPVIQKWLQRISVKQLEEILAGALKLGDDEVFRVFLKNEIENLI